MCFFASSEDDRAHARNCYLFNVLLRSKEIARRVCPLKIKGYILATTTRIPISVFTSKLYDQNPLQDIRCYRYHTGKIIH